MKLYSFIVGLISLAPEFFRAVSAVQSNNTSVADEYIKILLHRLTSNGKEKKNDFSQERL